MIRPNKKLHRFPSGIIEIPPSKSLSHRALICSSLASIFDGEASKIINLGVSEDINASMSAMSRLINNETEIECGESASTLRFILPIAALSERSYLFTGKARLFERPLDVYDEVFSQANVYFEKHRHCVKIKGKLKSGNYSLRGDVSSQFVSGLLMSLAMADGDSRLELKTELESSPYVDMTIHVMEHYGVNVFRKNDRIFEIPGAQRYRQKPYTVESDYSQAAFFLSAAALGRSLTCSGLSKNSIQGDKKILDVLSQMGAEIHHGSEGISVHAEKLKSVTVDARNIPDLVPPIAVLCCYCEGQSRIINAGRLRLKESDRLDVLCTELEKLGADISQDSGSLIINGKNQLKASKICAHNDHRIAMALALAAIGCDASVELSGWESVNKSYPNFWNDFEKEPR